MSAATADGDVYVATRYGVETEKLAGCTGTELPRRPSGDAARPGPAAAHTAAAPKAITKQYHFRLIYSPLSGAGSDGTMEAST